MKVTKPGKLEVSEGKIEIDSFDFETEEGDVQFSYYKAALAACEWAKAEMDKQLVKLFEAENPKDKSVLLNSMDELDIVDGCYRLDPEITYIVATPFEFKPQPIEDKTPYYRKFERNKRNK